MSVAVLASLHQLDRVPAPTEVRPTHLLVAIDVSASMRRGLNPTAPGGISRIKAVRDFAVPRIRGLDQAGDKIGVWLFTTSKQGLREKCDGETAPCKLVPLADARPDTLGKARDAIASLRANSGGTPLYKVIADGVQELRNVPNAANAVRSLVVLTDGFDRGDDADNSEDALDAAVDKDYPVQVLITATGQQLCDDTLEPIIIRRFGGHCFDATSIPMIQRARDVIRSYLRNPAPPP